MAAAAELPESPRLTRSRPRGGAAALLLVAGGAALAYATYWSDELLQESTGR